MIHLFDQLQSHGIVIHLHKSQRTKCGVSILGEQLMNRCVFLCLVAQETGLLALAENAAKLIDEYTNFLSRSNMK